MNGSDVQSSGSHNLSAIKVVSNLWSGITVQTIHVEALPGRSWHLLTCDHPVLSVVVNESGGRCEARPNLSTPLASRYAGRQRPSGHVSVIPAAAPVWGYSDNIGQVDEVRLILDVDRVREIMDDEFTAAPLEELCLVFNDVGLQELARLMVLGDDETHWSALFADSVVTAMVARLSHLKPSAARDHRRLGLTAGQLTKVTDFIRDNLARQIRLSELAALAGLSPSQFGRAFKTSTGTTPHLWHLGARVEGAKRLLANRHNRLVDIALDLGFSEQSHFNRAFRAATGVSPGIWRRRLTN
jgi:AraC family transcriptional regulator